MEVFVSGYGMIDGPKLVFYPSPEFVEFGKSTVTSGIVVEGTTAYFGGDPRHPDENGFTLVLVAATPADASGERLSMFSDRPGVAPSPVPQVLAETVQRNPPVLVNLATRKSVRPGTHWMHFVLTYFNGEVWVSTTTTAEFTVRTFIQRHEPWAWALGITATVCSLLGFLLQVLG
ncbi:MAG: hypothetical protein L6R43_02940 [Planctomycetes bacterium]|nr:hypothetical protein [Planctomycetota bacterium]